jgi:hypothetical protein
MGTTKGAEHSAKKIQRIVDFGTSCLGRLSCDDRQGEDPFRPSCQRLEKTSLGCHWGLLQHPSSPVKFQRVWDSGTSVMPEPKTHTPFGGLVELLSCEQVEVQGTPHTRPGWYFLQGSKYLITLLFYEVFASLPRLVHRRRHHTRPTVSSDTPYRTSDMLNRRIPVCWSSERDRSSIQLGCPFVVRVKGPPEE